MKADGLQGCCGHSVGVTIAIPLHGFILRKFRIAGNNHIRFCAWSQFQYLTAFDLTAVSDDTGTEISGILGFTLLRLLDIKIDYRDGLVDFGYTASPWQQ